MAEQSYSEKLRDPRWQKKRLEILEAARWKCEDCGTETDELQIHHCYYKKGAEPWEYTANTLMALCRLCHENRQEEEATTKEWLAVLMRFMDARDIVRLGIVISHLVEKDIRYRPEDENAKQNIA